MFQIFRIKRLYKDQRMDQIYKQRACQYYQHNFFAREVRFGEELDYQATWTVELEDAFVFKELKERYAETIQAIEKVAKVVGGE